MKLGLIFTLWLGAIIAGFGYTMVWSYSPGERAVSSGPRKVVSGVQIQALIHPLCPCSEATLELVKQALTNPVPPHSLDIVFCGEQQESKNISLARSIPGAKVSFISEEDSAKRFGTATSGHIFVWSQNRLVFSGGITDARGESSKGAAYGQFVRALTGDLPTGVDVPTYGCPVQGGR